ncbi:MAG: flavodoxin [Kiritimatiellae bacterium]|nr:flavodoxin [Kiritimatiellia bacterium]
MKTLVAYFSATGTTKAKAALVAKATGGRLVEITPEKPYNREDLDWHNKQSRSSVEMNDKKSRPAVKTRIADIADYDVVYLGFPIWWYVAPTVVNTFLEAHDLKGKKIVPFFTSGGSGAGKTLDYLKPSAPGATFETPKNLTDASETDIAGWVSGR